MARDKTGARKPAELNPDSENRLNGGDEHSLATLGNAAAVAVAPGDVTSAISLTAGSLTYTQNFDSLPTTGTGLTAGMPTDWTFGRTPTALTTYGTGTGSSNAGNIYSFGVAGTNVVTDRALGSVSSSSNTYYFGANFTNDTGGTITSLLISYFGEQWRDGGNASLALQKLDFQYSLTATSVSAGSWIDWNPLDFTSPIATAVAGALDGNASANRVGISSTITSLSIANGATFWIRWFDIDDTGSDHGLAVDNFSMTAGVAGTLSIDDFGASEGNAGTTAFSFTVHRTGGTDGAVGATWTLNAPEAPASPTAAIS